MLLYEFKDGLNQYLKAAGSPHASLEAIIAFNKAHADTVMPFFGQELFERAQAKGPLTDAGVSQGARQRAAARRQGRPAGGARSRPARCHHRAEHVAGMADRSVLGDHFVGAGYGMAAVAGTPSITVPVGDVHGLPLGLTIMGRAYDENGIIALASAIEQKMKARTRAAVHADTREPMNDEANICVASPSALAVIMSSYRDGPAEFVVFTI